MKELKIKNVLDSHLSPLAIDDVSIPIELATDKIRITENTRFSKNLTIEGDLFIEGSTSDIKMTDGVIIRSTANAGFVNLQSLGLIINATSYTGEDGDASDNDAAIALIPSTDYDAKINFFSSGADFEWTIGNDADDSDSFKFDAGTTVVGFATKLTLDSSGNMTLVGDLAVNGDDITTDGDMNLDSGGSLTLDAHDGNFIAKKAGTEFSAANSAYAGMILGYTDIGLDEARQTYTLTTSFVVPTDEFSVSFKAPPSGNVEIMISVRFNAGSSGAGDLYAGLSPGNATLGYVQLADFHEEFLVDQSGRNSVQTIQNYWTLTGLTAGTAYEYWVGFKSSSTSGTPMLEYGGSVSGHNPDFIMKATALPATITT